MAELSGVQILQNELERSKEKLKEFNQNIKKLTGHENPRGRRNFESQDYDDSFSGRMGRGRGRVFGVAKRGLAEDSGPPVKRRVVGGAFSRLGPMPLQRRVREDSPEDEEQPKRLSVHSSVVSTSREAKNRQDIMQEQTKDKEGMQRNRRMFGLLLGTLNKFKTDSKTLETKEEQRRRIDQKLEENAEKEKKKFKQETMQLMEERHLEETRVSKLEQKMEVVQEHADREKEIKKLKNFLCTKTKPRIFWKPRQMNTAADNKLKDSVKVVEEMLQTSQDRLDKEIKDVMEREQKREERIKMRLREDGLFLDDEENEKGRGPRDRIEGDEERRVTEGEQEKQRIKNRLGDEADEKPSVRKMKTKRRVVVEEQSDGGTEGEDSSKDDAGEEIRKNESERKGAKSNMQRASDDSGDESSESDSDSDKDIKPKKEKTDKDGSDKDKTDDDEESSRVVLYRENSKDKSKKDRKRDGDEKSERRNRDEKHSHHHSKHSKSEKGVEEKKEARHEKKKSKSSDRTVVEEEEERKVRNPMNLMGEEDDVEMESEIK